MVSIQQFTPQRQATIARDGNTLIVNDAAHKDCRCPGDFFYAVELQHDSISIQGNNREQGQVGYQLGLSPQGVQVHSTLGRSEMIMNVASETPLSAQQQRDVGMNVASSLVGLPLLAIDETATATASGPHTADEKKKLLEMFQQKAGKDPSFPDPNDGYYGLNVFLMEGDEAKKTAAFGQSLQDSLPDFSQEHHSVLVTANSFDEPTLGIFMVDRKTGELVGGLDRNTVDLPYQKIAAQFPEVSEDEAMFAVVGELASRGEKLGVVAGESDPDEMDFASWK